MPPEKNNFDNIKKPIRPAEPKNLGRPEGVSAKEDTILKSELGPKYAEFKYSRNKSLGRKWRNWRTS